MFKDIYIQLQSGTILDGASIIMMRPQTDNEKTLSFIFRLLNGEEFFGVITLEQYQQLQKRIEEKALFFRQ